MTIKHCLAVSFFAIFILNVLEISALEKNIENLVKIFDESKLIRVSDAENNVGSSANEKGEELCEGDMVCDKKSSEGGSDRNAITGEQFRWNKENGIVIVPYVFDPTLEDVAKNSVLAAAADYAGWTCIKFVERKDQADYIRFYKGGGCWSKIGKQGGMQDLSLGEHCGYPKGVPTHEMMHAMGFNHEQGRHDRDKHVTIVTENISPNHEQNFIICDYCTDPAGMPYDYRSVMHYGSKAFSENGQDTIVPKDGDPKQLGQRGGLCTVDIKKLNQMYKCGGVTASPTKPNNGVVPCDQPTDLFVSCPNLVRACSDPYDDYQIMRNCPVSCVGKTKDGLYDRYKSCPEFANNAEHDYCTTYPAIRDHCTLSCSLKDAKSGGK